MTTKKLKSIDIINVLSDLVSEKMKTTVKLPNDLLVIHGTEDKTVPYEISERYTKLFGNQMIFHPVEGATHNYDNADHIHEVLSTTYKFLTEQAM